MSRPGPEAKLEAESVLAFFLCVRLVPSFSVSESNSVSGPSVSVAVSPSVADGVVELNDTVDWLRGRSLAEVLSPAVFRAAALSGVRCANSFR